MDDVSQAEPALMLEAFAPYRLAVAAHTISRALSEVYTREFGLSIPEWRVLANLGRFGPLNAGELAERSSMDKPKVTRALQRLEARGLTQRAVVSADRRQVRLALTRRGRLVFRQIAALALDWEAGLLGALSEAERKALDRILTKLMRQAETMRAAAQRVARSRGTSRGAEAL
ncbi:MAG: MarR family transcriptional regulator [Hyphomonadaceae bacterium]|nr:MarR family transcriptional regulator [Hyphomonadaceae bacterium]